MNNVVIYWLAQALFWAAGAVFSRPMERREGFIKRLTLWATGIIIYLAAAQYALWNGPDILETAARVISAVIMVLFIYSCWNVTPSVAIYNSIWAIAVWQLALELWTVIELLGRGVFGQNVWAACIRMAVFFAISYIICVKTIAAWMPVERKEKIGPRQLSSALLLFVAIEVLALSKELRYMSEYNSDWKYLYLCQLICIIILYLQSEVFKKSALRQELALMNLLWKKEQEQYKLTKENINLINQKCHDLKHQIRALRKVSKEEFDKYLDGIEEAVEIYEAIVKTGNDVFDTILTEKSLYCKSKEIQVSCVADGSQMDFIETIDLYAILGNAMDNAIEAVEKFDEPEKRQIDVMIYRQQSFLVMNFINPISEQLTYDGELPLSTKGDNRYHGYGLRSMQHFVKKYDGHMNVTVEDGCFSLKIMIPVR